MRFLYYTGCVIPYRAPNYDISSRRLLEHLNVELVDMPDAGCCGIYVRQVNELKSLVLAARIWTMAETAGLDILSPCPGCVSTLLHARNKLNAEEGLKAQVNEILSKTGREFKGTQTAKHILRVLEEDIGLETIQKFITHPLKGNLAAHYGCHLVRPATELEYQDSEVPDILDRLIELTGAQSIDYYDKMGCCGMNVQGNENLRQLLGGRKLIDVKTAGAQALVMSCPACYLALGLNQVLADRTWETAFNLPVIHIPQLLGLAMGMSPQEIGLERNRPKVDLEILGLVAEERQFV
jgi:heterodisulfide reductase subunit B